LSTFFGLLAMLNYAKYVAGDGGRVADGKTGDALSLVTRHSSRFYWLALFCFALGLMSKPMLVTLPCVLLLLDFWPLGRISNFKFQISDFRAAARLVLEKIPFFLVAFAASLVTFLAQSQPGSKAVASLDLVSLNYRLKNIPVAYVEYLSKTFWPSKLAIFYPLPAKIEMYQVMACAGVLVLLTYVAVRLHRLRPYWLTGWLWFVGMLVPVSGIVQAGGAQIADRYSYLPAVGIYIIVTFAALDLAARWRISGQFLGALAVAILLACAATMEKQLWHWQNSETLFRHALAVTADNDVSRNNLGVALEQQNRLAEAAEQYSAAARLAPDRYQGFHNLANVLDRLGQRELALENHRCAVEIDPGVQFLHNTYAMALNAAGRTNEALQAFAEAARLDPKYPWPQVETAKIYLQQGRDADAVESLRAAVRSAPDNVDILTFTARVLAASDNAAIRDGHSAFALAAKANLLTSGRRPEVLDVLGMACAEMGKFDEAKLAAESALEVSAALHLRDSEPVRHRLELYKKHQPWRESFGATNTPAIP
jgi:tetratricopeptide (TPR) repeat protein